jgi:cytochrome c oxidase subunit 2
MPIVGGIVIPTVVLAGLFALTLGTLSSTSPATSGAVALTVQVTGRQWFWDVTYPSARIRTANEIHIPVGVPVRVEVSSGDVIHSFWVPELDRKIDMIPGRTNAVKLEAVHPGTYRGQCAEFCGLQHANMSFLVVAESREDFDTWLAAQSKPARPPPTAALERGQQIFLGSGCVYCHTIAGTNASGKVGPDLTHLASRSFVGAGVRPNSPGNLAGWILDPQHMKPGNRMPGTDLTGPQLQDLLDYLESLR